MVAQNQVDEVQRLLATGEYSYRTIAKMTGLNRTTVSAIAQGKRKDFVPWGKKAGENPFNGPIERCPECGARVYMPCVACKARHVKQEEEWNDPEPIDNDFPQETPNHFGFGLKLEDEHRERYEEVRQQRRLQELMSDPQDRREDDCPRVIYDASLFFAENLRQME